MKLAIMQPYLFPYLGYFQLIRAVDSFVVYDDVNYIKGGWINRNYILAKGVKQLITLPLQGASPNKLINQVEVGGRHKILESIRHSYAKATHFDAVYSILEDILSNKERNLAKFLNYQLRRICEYLGLSPQWHISSRLLKDNELRGQNKVLSICELLNASHYVNLPGGRVLYDERTFNARGLQLSFIQPNEISYHQFGIRFASNLSIIDVMMFNDTEECSKLLKAYDHA